MADAQKANALLSLNLRRVIPPQAPGPTLVHKFVYTRIGSEVLVELGYFDLRELKTVIDSKQTSAEIAFHVIAQLSLPPHAAVDMLKCARELVADLQREKLLPDTLPEEV